MSAAAVTKMEQEIGAKNRCKPDNAKYQVLCKPRQIPYAFSFPLCDLLICEFPDNSASPVPNSEQGDQKVPFGVSRTPTSLSRSIERVTRVAYYVYQKVVRRKAIPYQPSPKNPNYLLCYVEEELECGHKVTIHPGALETLTARKRNCSECSSWFGGLKLPEGKKANASILRSYERIKKQAGESIWPMFAAALAFCGLIFIVHPWAKIRVFCSTCAPQTSFRVLKSYNKRDFLMQRVVDGIPEAPEMRRFDEDSPLEQGFTLTYLKFEDRGSVWSVRGIDPYFRLERDANGMTTVPPNCVNVTGKPVVCDGEPQF